MEVMWVNYVHQIVPGATSTAERRRTLVFELSTMDAAVPRRELMDFTRAVRGAYESKTTKTLCRDLNFLRERHLVSPKDKGWIANKDLSEASGLTRSLSTSEAHQDDLFLQRRVPHHSRSAHRSIVPGFHSGPMRSTFAGSGASLRCTSERVVGG